MSQDPSSSSSELDFRAAVLSGLSGGRSLRESSVSSEESADSGDARRRVPEVVSVAPPTILARSAPRAQPGAWSAAVRPAAAAAAVAQPPPSAAAAGRGLRSIVVRPGMARAGSPPAPPPPQSPGRARGLLSVMVAPASARFRNLKQGQSSRPQQPPQQPSRQVVDAEGWQVVRRKKEKVKSPSPPRRPVPRDLNGVCFNCLERGHVRAACRPPSHRRASVAASLVTVLRTAPSVGAGPGLVAASPLRRSRVGARSRGANPDVALCRALLRQPRGDGLSRRPARRPRSAPGDQHPQEALPSTRPSRSRPRLARLPGRLASSSRRGARSRAAPP